MSSIDKKIREYMNGNSDPSSHEYKDLQVILTELSKSTSVTKAKLDELYRLIGYKQPKQPPSQTPPSQQQPGQQPPQQGQQQQQQEQPQQRQDIEALLSSLNPVFDTLSIYVSTKFTNVSMSDNEKKELENTINIYSTAINAMIDKVSNQIIRNELIAMLNKFKYQTDITKRTKIKTDFINKYRTNYTGGRKSKTSRKSRTSRTSRTSRKSKKSKTSRKSRKSRTRR